MEFDYLIIGGGVAGHRCAEEIRKRDSQGSIALVSDEKHHLYSRVLLPHYLLGKVPREKIFLVKPEWYAEQSIRYLAPASVVKIDFAKHLATLNDDQEIQFKKIFLGIGVRTRQTGEKSKTMHEFRNLDDADRLGQALKELEKSPLAARTAAIYGAGFMSAEFLNLFSKHQAQIDLYFRGQRYLARMIGEAGSKLLETNLAGQGVRIHPGTSSEDFIREAKSHAISGLAAGVEASLELFKNTKLKIDGGILVNEKMETNLPEVWAGGDGAAYFDPLLNRHHMAGNWLAADMQGRIAGANMVRESKIFSLTPSYTMDILGTQISTMGDVSQTNSDRVEVLKIGEGLVEKWYRAGKLIGVSMVGTAEGRMDLMRELK